MSEPRRVEVIYCDDIRQEVGNKPSFMGVYMADLVVQSFPAKLLKLCVFVNVSTSTDEPFKKITVRILQDERQLLEITVPDEDLISGQRSIDVAEGAEWPRFAFHFALILSPLDLVEAGKIRVRVETENGELRGRALPIKKAPAEQLQAATPPVH